MFIIANFLLAKVFSHYKYLCVTLDPPSHIFAMIYFIVLSPDFLYNTTYEFPWDIIPGNFFFQGIPIYICLIKIMDSLLTNQVVLAAQVTEALNRELY